MKYHFEDIENGQITEGYNTITIVNHEAEIKDEAKILLAEKHGGELASSKAKSKPVDTKKLPELKPDNKQESKGE